MAENIGWPGWNVVKVIGKGSYGSVYEIERDVFGTTEKAALKIISIPQNESDVDDLISDGYDSASITQRYESYLKDIVREYSLMAEMKGNSNIVDCDDLQYVPHENGIGWDISIKMELLTPLTRALGNEITEEQTIRLGKDICNALILCKSKNIVHRDIKPQNIFVSKHGQYKLGDFGIAKVADRATTGTKTGTFKYMAPEVYNNQPYGHPADIYSLGIVLYWMLNERRTPFLPLPPKVPTATIEEEAQRRRFSGEPVPPPVNGSDDLKYIVMKACAYDPADRYKTAEELLEDLNALSSGKNDATVLITRVFPEAPAKKPAEQAATAPTPAVNIPTDFTDPSAGRQQPQAPIATPPPTPNPQTYPQTPAAALQTPAKPSKKLIGIIAGAAAALVLVIALIATVFSGGGRSSSDGGSSSTPAKRQMMSDAAAVLRDEDIPGSITGLEITDESVNEKFHVYIATCSVTVSSGQSESEYTVTLKYEQEKGEWVLSDSSSVD